MIRLVIHAIGVTPDNGKEASLAKIESDRFDPDHLETQVNVALDIARSKINGADLSSLRSWQLEVSAVLTASNEAVRPSLHLTTSTLQRLVSAGASFDFDPYI